MNRYTPSPAGVNPAIPAGRRRRAAVLSLLRLL